MKKLLTADEVADLLAIKRKTVYNLAASGTIPCVRIGPRTVRFDPDRLAEWVREQGEESTGIRNG
ncbi:MAG TPA: helix-turn-helix domain-containing protein [Solirubrobacter sp.]|nr:helix-turn-helix domain-containing protein [Solirubrobacter sp.]